MEIVFYSHRVSYPNCLSAQVLPQELKNLAIDRLESVEKRLFTFKLIQTNSLLETITRQQIKDNINYLKARDQHHLWQDFIKFNTNLDQTRKQDLFQTIPEFKRYV
jgi:hypothetical protein